MLVRWGIGPGNTLLLVQMVDRAGIEPGNTVLLVQLVVRAVIGHTPGNTVRKIRLRARKGISYFGEGEVSSFPMGRAASLNLLFAVNCSCLWMNC